MSTTGGTKEALIWAYKGALIGGTRGALRAREREARAAKQDATKNRRGGGGDHQWRGSLAWGPKARRDHHWEQCRATIRVKAGTTVQGHPKSIRAFRKSPSNRAMFNPWQSTTSSRPRASPQEQVHTISRSGSHSQSVNGNIRQC
ncbi:unnamed protein product [Calypogeia fissa]